MDSSLRQNTCPIPACLPHSHLHEHHPKHQLPVLWRGLENALFLLGWSLEVKTWPGADDERRLFLIHLQEHETNSLCVLLHLFLPVSSISLA